MEVKLENPEADKEDQFKEELEKEIVKEPPKVSELMKFYFRTRVCPLSLVVDSDDE